MRRLIFPTFATLVVSAFVGFTVLTTDSQAASSIVTRLSPDHTAVEVVSEPEGTASINVAILNQAQTETKYLWPRLPASQMVYKPPAGYPVVDMEARNSSGQSLGSWAGRLTTATAPPAEETQAEREAREAREREAKEREARERAEREAREKLEREQREKEEAEHPSGMVSALDDGGWVGESITADISGAVKYTRSRTWEYNTDEKLARLARYGIHIMPIFENWEAPSSMAANALGWCRRYCKGGTFWQGKTDLGAETLEIVNEPGNPYMGEGRTTTDEAQYAQIVEATASALKGLPSTQPQPRLLVSYDGGYAGDSYGRALVQADPNLLKLKIGWTVHPYGGKSDRTQSALGGRTRVTESLRPVYVTEVGWPTAVGQPSTGDSFQWTEQQQAENIVGFVRWARGLGYVNDVTIFQYRDYGSNNWYGIESSSGRHKPSYQALKSA
jgi:hypothetical protein